MIIVKGIPDPKIKCDFEKIYYPSDDSYLIIDYFKANTNEESFDGLEIEKIKHVLDLGTGSGVIAILLKFIKRVCTNFNPKIYASDILEEAVECARVNEILNFNEKGIEFIQSNLFDSFPDSLRRRFDIIVFNPPYLPSSSLIEKTLSKRSIDFSWNGGVKGYGILLKFFNDISEFLNLNQSSFIYYISSSRTNLTELNNQIRKKGFKTKTIKKRHLFFEDIILNRAKIV